MRLKQQGSVLLGLLIILPILLVITGAYLSLASNSTRVAIKDQLHTHSQLAADAGVDFAMYSIGQDNAWTGTGTEIELNNDGKIKTTYEVEVINNNSDSKTVASIGRSYKPTDSTTPDNTIKIEATLRPVTSGNFSVVTGVGGLYMSNSAKILGGSVHVNGEVQLSNTAQIGLTTNPVTITVAHQNCPNPVDASYPRLCNSGENGQPITINNSAHIYGNVKANNQTNNNGMSSPGLTSSSGVTAKSLPAHDRDAQKAAISSNQSGTQAGCSGNNTTKTWPANLKITGNVNISNRCKVTIEGDVWITGKLTLSNSSEIKVSNNLGTTRPNIMVDGGPTAVNLNNSSKLVNNNSDTGFKIITYWSAANCSPDCADVTGVDLNNSRQQTTIDMSNSADADKTILYAKWSRVTVSNTGQIGALVGQTVQLNNSAVITFGTSAGESSTYWVVDHVRRVFD